MRINIYCKVASDISPEQIDRRYLYHHPVNIGALLFTPLGEVIPVTVTDVSSCGFRLRADYGVTIGRSLILAVPGLAKYSGWVAWSYLGEFGLEGAQTISEHAIEEIVGLGDRSTLI